MVDKIIAYEAGKLNNKAILELFSELIKTGQAWKLQGAYGRTAKNLMDKGLILKDGVIDWERYQKLLTNKGK